MCDPTITIFLVQRCRIIFIAKHYNSFGRQKNVYTKRYYLGLALNIALIFLAQLCFVIFKLLVEFMIVVSTETNRIDVIQNSQVRLKKFVKNWPSLTNQWHTICGILPKYLILERRSRKISFGAVSTIICWKFARRSCRCSQSIQSCDACCCRRSQGEKGSINKDAWTWSRGWFQA